MECVRRRERGDFSGCSQLYLLSGVRWGRRKGEGGKEEEEKEEEEEG